MIKLKSILMENNNSINSMDDLIDAALSKKIYGELLDLAKSDTSVSMGSPYTDLVWYLKRDDADNFEWKVTLTIDRTIRTGGDPAGDISISVQCGLFSSLADAIRSIEKSFRKATNASTNFYDADVLPHAVPKGYQYSLQTLGKFRNNEADVAKIFHGMLLIALKELVDAAKGAG